MAGPLPLDEEFPAPLGGPSPFFGVCFFGCIFLHDPVRASTKDRLGWGIRSSCDRFLFPFLCVSFLCLVSFKSSPIFLDSSCAVCLNSFHFILSQLETIGQMPIGFLCIFLRKYNFDVLWFCGGLQNWYQFIKRNQFLYKISSFAVMTSLSLCVIFSCSFL